MIAQLPRTVRSMVIVYVIRRSLGGTAPFSIANPTLVLRKRNVWRSIRSWTRRAKTSGGLVSNGLFACCDARGLVIVGLGIFAAI